MQRASVVLSIAIATGAVPAHAQAQAAMVAAEKNIATYATMLRAAKNPAEKAARTWRLAQAHAAFSKAALAVPAAKTKAKEAAAAAHAISVKKHKFFVDALTNAQKAVKASKTPAEKAAAQAQYTRAHKAYSASRRSFAVTEKMVKKLAVANPAAAKAKWAAAKANGKSLDAQLAAAVKAYKKAAPGDAQAAALANLNKIRAAHATAHKAAITAGMQVIE